MDLSGEWTSFVWDELNQKMNLTYNMFRMEVLMRRTA